MLRKTFHWAALAVAAILWLLAAWGTHQQDNGRLPARVAAIVEADLQRRTHAADALGSHQEAVRAWIRGAMRGKDSNWIFRQPYRLFAYRNDSLVAWSTASVLPPGPLSTSDTMLRLGNGIYYGRRLQAAWMPAGISMTLIIPLARQYPFSNEYLQPSFAASKAIDPHVQLADTPVAGATPLHSPGGRRIGWVLPHPPGEQPEPPADWIVWCWLLSLVAFAVWVQGWAVKLSQRAGTGWSMFLIIGAAIGIRMWLLIGGLPFRVSESALFSPRLYASNMLPSLGDLLLHLFATLWVLRYLVARLPLSSLRLPAVIRWLLAVLSGFLLLGAGVVIIRLLRSLVLDSLIPFDTVQLSAVDAGSMAGLLVAILLLSLLLIIATAMRDAMRILLPLFWTQILVLAGSAILLCVFLQQDVLLRFYCIGAIWLCIYVLAQRVARLREGGSFFQVSSIFWSIGHCLLLALLLQHFSRVREGETRRHFAEHIATRHDDAMEYNFGQSLTTIRTDTSLQRFIRRPTPAARKALEERLATRYFNNSLPAYQAQVYLFSTTGLPLFNRDTTTLDALERISESSIPSRTASDLFFREAATDDHIYLALLPLLDSAGAPLGTMAIDLEQKKTVAETVLPELLQPATINQTEKAAGYSYAIYAGGRLVAQTSDYPFPFYIAHDTSRAIYRERRGKDFSTLIYTPDAYRSVYVWRRFGTLSETLTLFSYFLLLRFLLLGLGVVSRSAWLRHPSGILRAWRGAGLRRRLQLSIMSLVALSAVAIAIGTVAFLRRQYDNTSKAQRQAMMQTVARALQQWMRDRDGDNSPQDWEAAMATPDFRYFLSGLAAAQKIDINIFDAAGRLSNTTQQAVYDQELRAPLMRYDVLQALRNNGARALITEVERIGSLRYQSCYAPLRTEGGEAAAYLNVPLFYAQRELDEQISTVVVTLVNLYAVALLLSALLAYFITRWVTSAFDLIIRQFGRLNLHRNELLEWPYDDEIGVLVAEYNKMVRKVEESVALLARSERESAFREMARQVAHEIKNPLTPMSLYVQRLQRAIHSGEPDAMALAGRVSEALLEQINNLSVIATEFGAFASIGSSKPELLELSEIVRNVVAPFAASDTEDVLYEGPQSTLRVLADRSGIVRIVTNLMQNALQAIPASRKGQIRVMLVQDGDEAVLSVSDNGAGISPEAQEKLFTPYFTTKTSGTGLGLAMTRQMIEGWHGTISYETAEGVGTTFTIRLPVLA